MSWDLLYLSSWCTDLTPLCAQGMEEGAPEAPAPVKDIFALMEELGGDDTPTAQMDSDLLFLGSKQSGK